MAAERSLFYTRSQQAVPTETNADAIWATPSFGTVLVAASFPRIGQCTVVPHDLAAARASPNTWPSMPPALHLTQ